MDASYVRGNESKHVILGLYTIFFLYHALNKGRIYRPKHPVLFFHMLSGTCELVLYYGCVKCSRAAILACWVHSLTSLILVKTLPNGYPPHTRPAYQAGSIIRSILVLRAYHTQDPAHYHDTIMPLHGFVYTRALIFLLGTMGPSRNFIKNVNSRFVYAESVLGAALISISHCNGSWPVPTYLMLMHTLGKLSLWVGEQYDFHRIRKSQEPKLIQALRSAGFGAHDAYTSVTNVPSIGNLPMDKLGAIWAKA